MNRRTWLRAHAALAAACLAQAPGTRAAEPPAEPPAEPTAEGRVMTVTGPVDPAAVGRMLPHEHAMSTFGAPAATRPRYDEAALFNTVVPALRRLRRAGCDTLADATAAYFGRAPRLLQHLSVASGVQILTNTGYYGAADDRYVPAHAYRASADALAARWLREWEEGIDGTGIRPGFVKIGVDAGPLSPIDGKLVRAAARLHRASGLTIAVHTGNNPASAAAQLATLAEEGVAPAAWIWVHAHSAPTADVLLPAAHAGAWLSLDGLQADAATLDHHAALLLALRAEGLLAQVLLSHDGNAFRADGRPPRPFDALFTHFLPRLAAAGLTPAEVHQLTVANPARAFTVRRRLAG